jgi:hypothetical protein
MDNAPLRAPLRAASDMGRRSQRADNVLLGSCLCLSRQKAVPRDGLELGWIVLMCTAPILERPSFCTARQFWLAIDYNLNLWQCQRHLPIEAAD